MIPVTFDTAATLQLGSDFYYPTNLQFAIPEEWKNCKVNLHLRRNDGILVPPMQLDATGCVTVDGRSPGKTGGQWMLSAQKPDGETRYSQIGRYVTPKEVTHEDH